MFKKKIFHFLLLSLLTNIVNAQIGIGTSMPNATAALEIKDSTKGILIPRMTTTQRLAINSPAEGLMVYQTDSLKGYWYYNGLSWISVLNSSSSINFLGKTTIVLSDTISNSQAQEKIAREFGTNTEEINIVGCTNLTSIDLSMIKNVRKISIMSNSVLNNVNLSNLISAEGGSGGIAIWDNPLLSSLNLNSLKQVTGRDISGWALTIFGSQLSSLNFPSLIKVSGGIGIAENNLLTSISLPNLRNINQPKDVVITFERNKLPSAQINNLLSKFASATPTITGATFIFSPQLLPTGAPPTGQGIIDRNTLVANGNSVTTD